MAWSSAARQGRWDPLGRSMINKSMVSKSIILAAAALALGAFVATAEPEKDIG